MNLGVSEKKKSHLLLALSVFHPKYGYTCKKPTEKLQPQLSIFLVSITDRSLGESIPSNFIGNVGSTQGRAGDTETLLDNISKDVDIIAMNINTLPIQLAGIKMKKRETRSIYLDKTDSLGILPNVTLQSV